MTLSKPGILTCLIRAMCVHVTYLFTNSVKISCDSPNWLIQSCYQSASSCVTETTFLTKKCFSVKESYHCFAKYCNTNHCYCLATKGYLISP